MFFPFPSASFPFLPSPSFSILFLSSISFLSSFPPLMLKKIESRHCVLRLRRHHRCLCGLSSHGAKQITLPGEVFPCTRHSATESGRLTVVLSSANQRDSAIERSGGRRQAVSQFPAKNPPVVGAKGILGRWSVCPSS